MRKLALAVILSITLLAPALSYADPDNQNGCGPSGDKPKKCDDPSAPVPEPGIAILLGSGLLALGGLALARRKRESN